jgi:FkbM family methyltransferase
MKKLVRSITSRLPVRGLPVLFDCLSPVLFKSPSPANLRLGGIDLEVDLANRVMRNIYFGIYEKPLLAYLRALLKPGDTFIDVGASIGYLSAYARDLVGPTGAVHAFEPVPAYSEALTLALRAAAVTNVRVLPWALGDRRGTVSIKISGQENIGWNTIVPGLMREGGGLQTLGVPLTTLAYYLDENGISEVRLIKIDVEGAELLVLRGLAPWLARGPRPHLVTEVCPQACRLLGSSTRELFAFMEDFGYQAFSFQRRGWHRLYCGKVNLQPLVPGQVTRTMDVVWKPGISCS